MYVYVFTSIDQKPKIVCDVCLKETFGEPTENCHPTACSGPCWVCGKREMDNK